MPIDVMIDSGLGEEVIGYDYLNLGHSEPPPLGQGVRKRANAALCNPLSGLGSAFPRETCHPNKDGRSSAYLSAYLDAESSQSRETLILDSP